MSVVVDASVVVAALVDSGDAGRWAETVIAKDDLAAPELVLVEAANIIRRMELAGELRPTEAAASFRDAMRLEIDLHSFEPFAARVWELRSNLTSYDAWYVAVAEALELPVATLDRRLARSPGPACRFLLPE